MNYDYLINLIIIINIVLTFSANIPLAGETFKRKLQSYLTKPKSYLQSIPKVVSSIIFILIILGLFGIGKVETFFVGYDLIRLVCVGLYVTFSWIQIYSAKQLGSYYTQDVVIFKNHQVIEKGFYKIIRHPFYLSQMLQDLFAGIALSNILILGFTILFEIPLYILRTNFEEKLLEKNLPEYIDYKKKVGKWFLKLKK